MQSLWFVLWNKGTSTVQSPSEGSSLPTLPQRLSRTNLRPGSRRVAEACPGDLVENGADAWREGQGEPKNKFTQLQDLQISAALEETVFDDCMKSMTTCHHVQNRSKWQQQTGADERSVTRIQQTSNKHTCRQDNNQQKKGGRTDFEEVRSTWHNNVKDPVGNSWHISPLCHLPWQKSIVLDGTDNMQLSSPSRRRKQEKVSTVSSRSL